MTTIVIDAALREKLLAAGGHIELLDDDGMLVAHAFVHVPLASRAFLVGASLAVESAVGPLHSRFTDRAVKVMQLANQEAQRLNREFVGTEHVLLGLVKEDAGVVVVQ